jgi:thiol-disulfide isomerase/thioredoxin
MKLLEVTSKVSADKFIEKKKSGKPILMFVYASWCKYCVDFKPIWKSIIKALENDRSIHLVQVESECIKFMPKKHQQVLGYPTIQVVKNNTVSNFDEMFRTKENILMFANKFKA